MQIDVTNNLETRWGTLPFVYNDPDFGNITLSIKGTCKYFHNNLNINTDELVYNIVNYLMEYLKTVKLKYTEISTIVDDSFINNLNIFLQKSGFVITEFKIIGVFLEKESAIEVSEVNSDISDKKNDDIVVVQTDNGAKNGQNKCPKCGATDITLSIKNGKLRCRYCRYLFEDEKITGMVTDISELTGQVMGSGAQDIVADTNEVMTFKCSSCGSEVVIDTSRASQARCHWCRSILSINQQIPNGSIPDVVLPFKVSKDDAKLEIEQFVKKRKFFANSSFKKEFTTDNIMGVYFPYMVVDVNGHSVLVGQGEHLIRKYTVGSGDNRSTRYDAELYNVEREFDLIIEGLTVESSSDKLNKSANDKTTNVINAIMPFDIENAIKWNANFLKGFTSEKRDTNVEQLKELVETQSKDIARFAANDSLTYYDRGVAWANEQFSIKGQQWKAAYLPVWLYSYQQVKGDKKLLHYVAVNARTKETMGSVPINMPKLLLLSFLIEIASFILMFFVDFDYDFIFLSSGIIFFVVMFTKYRNHNARHKHELETKKKINNLRKLDVFVKKRTNLSNAMITGANNKSVSGSNTGINQLINQFVDQETLNTINNINDK